MFCGCSARPAPGVRRPYDTYAAGASGRAESRRNQMNVPSARSTPRDRFVPATNGGPRGSLGPRALAQHVWLDPMYPYARLTLGVSKMIYFQS